MTKLAQIEAIANMERAFDLIVNYEFAWDQDHWRMATQETACGTALCFAGWATSAKYEPLISQPRQLAEQVGGWNTMEDEVSESLWSYIVVPEGDPFYDPRGSRVDYILDNWTFGPTQAALREKLAGKGVAQVIEVSALANKILDVASDNNADGILHASVFDGGNSLATIRAHIDSARERAGMDRRDFTTEPVTLTFDEWVPEETRPEQAERVLAFNRRAQTPDRDIRTQAEVARDEAYNAVWGS